MLLARGPTEACPPERRLGLIAALVIGNVVLSTSFQDALFLARHDKDQIPPAMLCGSLITAAVSLVVSRALRHASQAMALRVILLLLGALSVGFAVWNRHPGQASTFALFLFVELSTTLGVAATWSYFQAPLEPSQIRRLMPRLGTWAGIGGLFAGALIPVVLRRLHPQVLIGFSAVAWGLAGLLVTSTHQPVQRARNRGAGGLRTVLRLPLFRWMALSTGGILWMGLLVQYETRVAFQQRLTPPEIAQSMGALMAVTSVAGIAVQALLTRPILERWGVGLAMAVLPMSVAVLLGLYVPIPAVGLIASAFFIDKTLRPNLHRPAESCLLAALAPSARPPLLLVLGSIVGPLLKALGALCLWGAASAVPNHLILGAALLITAALAVLSTRWGQIYARTLRDTLAEGSVDMIGEAAEEEALIPLIDGPRLRILVEALTRGGPRARELALEMLRPHRSGLVRRAMLDMLGHPDDGVRISALRWFAEEPDATLLPALQVRWQALDEAARGAAAAASSGDGRTTAAHLTAVQSRAQSLPQSQSIERVALLAAAGDKAPALLGEGEVLARWLAAPDVALRAAVIRALLASSTPGHTEAAEQALHALLRSPDPEARTAGVHLLGERRVVGALPLLLDLLAQDTTAVRRAVLLCLPALRVRSADSDPGSSPPGGPRWADANMAPILAALSDKDLALTAERALASCGEDLLPEAERILGEAGTSPAVRLHLLRAVGQVPSARGAPLLLRWLGETGPDLQLEAARGLSRLRRLDLWEPSEADRRRIEESLLLDLRHGLRVRKSRDILRRVRPRGSLVLRELDAQLDAAQQRVFRGLSLLAPRDALVPVFNSLRATASPHREQARELLRTLIKAGPLSTGGLLLLDETMPFTEDSTRPPLSVFPGGDPEDALAWLRGTRDPWVLAALRHDPGHESAVSSSMDRLSLPPSLLAQLQAPSKPRLGKFHEATTMPTMTAFGAGASTSVEEAPPVAVPVAAPAPLPTTLPALSEDPMKASLDILLFLKDVALFEALTNQQLVEVAQLAERIDLPAGETLFQQGEMPDYLYLVREGKLIVRSSGQEVARLGPGECVGEMAVLADTERTATVVIAEACQLLRFEANVFKDLLDSYPEIGRGLLKSLVRRVANTSGSKKGARPMTMTGMVWGPGGPPGLK